ncbi:MAG: type II toxin-antitoxin system Phd/YefM family antitoxin [Beijerinckiaceae bacterium]
MPQFNVHDAKSNLSQLIEAALRGETVTIARRGKPAVRLVPVEPEADAPAAFATLAGLFAGKIVEIDPDWWLPSNELADLFEGKDPT